MRTALSLISLLAMASATYAQNVMDRLNERIPDITFTEQPFDQVMEFVGDFTKLNIVVRWNMLEDLGIERDKPISLNAKNLRVSQVLWMIMNEAGGSDVKLAYRASGNLLILSTAQDLGQEMIVKVYNFSDLLFEVKRFTNSPRIDLTQQVQGGGQGGGGGQGVFGGGQGGGQEDDEEDDEQGADTAKMEELVDLIVNTVEPDSWQINGGRGTISVFRRSIVVRNNIGVHQALGGPVSE